MAAAAHAPASVGRLLCRSPPVETCRSHHGNCAVRECSGRDGFCTLRGWLLPGTAVTPATPDPPAHQEGQRPPPASSISRLDRLDSMLFADGCSDSSPVRSLAHSVMRLWQNGQVVVPSGIVSPQAQKFIQTSRAKWGARCAGRAGPLSSLVPVVGLGHESGDDGPRLGWKERDQKRPRWAPSHVTIPFKKAPRPPRHLSSTIPAASGD